MSAISIIDGFIPSNLNDDYIKLIKARISVCIGSVFIVVFFLRAIGAFAQGDIMVGVFTTIPGLANLSGLIFLNKTRSTLWYANLIVGFGFAFVLARVATTGGINSLSLASLLVVIILAYLTGNVISGTMWSVACFAAPIVFFIMSTNKYDFGPVVVGPKNFVSISFFVVLSGICCFLFELASKNSAKKFLSERDVTLKSSEEQKKLLDDANDVMNAVSQGDLSKKITTNIEGDLGRLKDSVNGALNMLSLTIAQVADESEEILGASFEVSKASQFMASGTTQQAASLEEISSSINEIDGMAKNNNENASQARGLSNQTVDEIKKTNNQMEAMLGSMHQINETSTRVAKVIKVIDEIAFQTNLLALNAAVEAARAGKYGKGFAVVAEEVRNLASRSAEAAKDTTELVESSIKEVDNGVKNADQTAEIMKGFVASIEKVNDLVGEISSASQEQSNGVSEIGSGLSQVNDVIQKNSSVTEETASASAELQTKAKVLQEIMNRFKLKDDIRKNVRPPIAPTPEEIPPEPIAPRPQPTPAVEAPNKLKQIVLDDTEFGKY